MHELFITPAGHLTVREADAEEARKVPKALLEAYRESTANGLLRSATEDLETPLPLSFDFARSFARLYLTTLCRSLKAEIPAADLGQLLLQAPPMTGLEYLTLEAMTGWWRELNELVQAEIQDHPGGAAEYLKERNPQWRFVGRVTLHLAENKRDPDYPFAFLATFANGLTSQGKVKHEPLSQALAQYAGAKNREAMLSLLLPISKAAETCPLMKRLVETEAIYQPHAWPVRDAHNFLKSIPIYEASGLIVRVPDWWSAKKPSRPQVSVKVNVKNPATLGVDSLLKFSVGVSLEGEELSAEEIEGLLAAGGGLIPLKGKWIELDREKLQQALAHWKQVEKDSRTDGMSFFEGMRLLSGAGLESVEDVAKTAEIREWSGLTPGAELEAVLHRLRSPEANVEQTPKELKAELRPYQRVGYSWLRFAARLGFGVCLADDMGLGKTVQVIALVLDLQKDSGKDPSLLVVPASLIANWKSELTRFAPSLKFAVAHPSEPVETTSAKGCDLIITTYGMLVRTAWLRSTPWQLVILDEAQAIRNSGTQQARAAKELKAAGRIAMTGTPVENRLSDLWSIFDFLNPGLLGSSKQFGAFVKRLQAPASASFEPLRKLVRPYLLRRLKTDKQVIADLPEKTEVNAYCPLSPQQAALYQKAVDDLAQHLEYADGIQRRGIVLSQLMRLKQICNHPAQATGSADYPAALSGKFRRLAELAEEIAARQDKVLIFTQFREITAPLAEHLAGIFGRTGLVLHGGTSVKQRKSCVEEFQKESGPPFFVLSLKAGGTGLNLTAASHVIHFDRWWNPAVENQATDRAFRIGQKKNVLVHKFICRGTVEEKIDDMIAAKKQVALEAVGEGGGEALLTEMDNATLLSTVKLNLQQALEC